jgi:predicted transposase YbfD/YdcC
MASSSHELLARRLACILQRLNAGERLDITALAEEFSVHKRTIQRDLTDCFAFLPLDRQDGLYDTVRAHWGIENRLHWMLDVCFGEDDCMIRKDNAPQNLSLLKKIVLNLIRADKTDTAKTSLRLKRKRAAWDDDIRMKMLEIYPL